MNGNIAPFSHAAMQARPYPEASAAAADLRQVLTGSDLLKPSSNRALQDPLSYRSMAYTLGEVRSAQARLENALAIQINHTDDNPLVLINGLPEADDSAQMRSYEIDGAGSPAIVPTANFNFLPVASAVAALNEAHAKLSEIITQQTLRMENPEITKLPRFLSDPDNSGHAFGAIQKPFAASNEKIKLLARPLWYDGAVLAGNIEDTASMSEQTIQNGSEIIKGLYEIAAYQLLHAAQAVDLRQGLTLSSDSRRLYQAYRGEVPYLRADTPTTPLIEKSIRFLQQY
ncbi:aromatic amino acid lyase [Neisseria leonii]|uniref:aromatic amino acid lyase n=1 Tax=Neisseria leonii TaxID=2995413 RepID=UPI00237A6213|nr:aromatic amino acid lyase [Neisseria sp. 3986]MDD9325056.1 aromatic amino acid lyase [Neisseria sp. 3986]